MLAKTKYFAEVKMKQLCTWVLVGQIIGGQVAGGGIL